MPKPEQCPVDFSCLAPHAKAVSLVGTFNNWDARIHPMQAQGDGRWTLRLHLSPGFHHYKFVVDGHGCCIPELPADPPDCPGCVPNAYGTLDCVAVVG